MLSDASFYLNLHPSSENDESRPSTIHLRMHNPQPLFLQMRNILATQHAMA
jgi:hypothetical protein